MTLISDVLGRSVKLRISAHALKTVDHRGGLDAFLLKAREAELAPKAVELRRAVEEEARGSGDRSRRSVFLQLAPLRHPWIADIGAHAGCAASSRAKSCKMNF